MRQLFCNVSAMSIGLNSRLCSFRPMAPAVAHLRIDILIINAAIA